MKLILVSTLLLCLTTYANVDCEDYFEELVLREFEKYEQASALFIGMAADTRKPKYTLGITQKINVLAATLKNFDNLPARDFLLLFGFSIFEISNAHEDLLIDLGNRNEITTKTSLGISDPIVMTDAEIKQAYFEMIESVSVDSDFSKLKNHPAFMKWRDLIQSSTRQGYSFYN